MTSVEQLIRREIYKAIESLGGPPEVLAATISGASKDEMYDLADWLGADRYLLAAIGSWGRYDGRSGCAAGSARLE